MDYDIATKIELAMQDYNIAVCQKAASELLGRLPSELRIMVYSYLVLTQVTLCRMRRRECMQEIHVHQHVNGCEDVSRQNILFTSPQPYATSLSRTAADNLCPQHYWRGDVLGHNHARELMESFYRSSRFHLRSPCVPDEKSERIFSVIAKTDHFGLSFEPLKLISRFNLVLYVYAPIYGKEYTANQNNYAQDWVAQLFSLKMGARIEIQLSHVYQVLPSIGRGPAEIALINEVMETVMPQLVQLRRAGYKITVSLFRGWISQGRESVLQNWLEALKAEVSGTGDQLNSVLTAAPAIRR